MLRTSERVSFFAGPSPFAICEVADTVLDGLGGALDRTRSAQDFGGAGDEAGLDVSTDATGDTSDVAGTDVVDDRLACSEPDSSCGV